MLAASESVWSNQYLADIITGLAEHFQSTTIAIIGKLICFGFTLGVVCVTGIMLFPTATVNCYGSPPFQLLLANFILMLLGLGSSGGAIKVAKKE